MLGKEMKRLLMNEGFHEAGSINAYTDVIWKSQDGFIMGIVFVDAIMMQIRSEYGVERIKTACRAEYSYLDEILVILIGNMNDMRIHVKNLICVDCATYKMRTWMVAQTFNSELAIVRDYAKYKRLILKKQEHMYLGRKEHEPLIIWVLMLITFCISSFMMFADKSGWVISAAAVCGKNQNYRLVSYMFLHGSYAHLAGNMLSLIFVGNMLAKRIGNMRSSLIYMAGGILAGLVSVDYRMIVMKDATTQTVGASGAIFALLGALLCDIYMDDTMRHERRTWLKYAVLTFILSSIGGNIDIACHAGGFFGGIILMYCINLLSRISNDWAYIRLSRKAVRCERGCNG